MELRPHGLLVESRTHGDGVVVSIVARNGFTVASTAAADVAAGATDLLSTRPWETP